jgi:hypothetical protein
MVSVECVCCYMFIHVQNHIQNYRYSQLEPWRQARMRMWAAVEHVFYETNWDELNDFAKR